MEPGCRPNAAPPLPAEEVVAELIPNRLLPHKPPKKRRRTLRAGSPTARWEEQQEIIAKAAADAARDTEKYCEILDAARVPLPPTWRVDSWLEAWAKPTLRPKIRAFKSRHR